MCGGLLAMSLQAGGLAPSLDGLPCHTPHLSPSTSLTHAPIWHHSSPHTPENHAASGLRREKKLEGWHPWIYLGLVGRHLLFWWAQHGQAAVFWETWIFLLNSTCSWISGSCFLDRQGRSQASEGLVFGLPLLSAHSCSAVKIHHSHFPCPGLPLNGHVRTLPQGCYLALGNSVFIVSGTGRLLLKLHCDTPLEASQGQERIWHSPAHSPILQSHNCSSQKNMPVSTQCYRKPAPRAAGWMWIHPPWWPKHCPDGKNLQVEEA